MFLLLPACLDYEIAVTTVVQPDGTTRRKLVIREKEEKQTWKRLARPAAPYVTEGEDAEGFTATAELKPGRHPSGLRVLLGDAEKNPPAAEGTVNVEVVDLLIATVYRYEERIALGTDPARFREELPKWTELGLRYTLETLRIAFPEIDFAPVEAKARAEFLAAAERAILGALLAGQAALAEARARSPLHDDRIAIDLFRLLVGEMAPLGVSVKLPDGPPWDDEELEAVAEKAGRQVAERLLAPLAEAERAKVIDAIFSGDALKEAADAAGDKLWPTEEAGKLGNDLQAFASSALGAYVTYGLLDSFHMRFRVELPGRLLRTNGDLSRLPAVEWNEIDLVLAPPVLFATSFVPREGAGGEGWDATTLEMIGKALAELTPEQRAALGEVVAKALKAGWPDDPPLEGEESLEAYGVLRDAARPPEPPPSK